MDTQQDPRNHVIHYGIWQKGKMYAQHIRRVLKVSHTSDNIGWVSFVDSDP